MHGTVTLNRGDLRGTFTLVAEAENYAERCADDLALLEVAALKAQLNFFSGAYAEALRYARSAVELADRSRDPRLRLFARRAACPVLGNLDPQRWRGELDELLRLSVELGDRWQEALSRNDLAQQLMGDDDAPAAEQQLRSGLEIAAELAPRNRVALAVLFATRAELRLRTHRPEEALADTQRALEELTAAAEPNPYLFGMTVSTEVESLLALGRPDEAQRCGERAVERLEGRVPQARSMILVSVAAALRGAGRLDGAYDALARGAELERTALQELSELQLAFERSTLETKAARARADAFAEKNRELEEVELQLREQADRDPLTGLYNRRFLSAEFERLAREPQLGALSIAVFDLDHFKAINDDFGHAAGDQVLVRTATLLRSVVRAGDIVARTGGEEFVLLMAETGAAEAILVCERLLAALRAETWQRVGVGVRLTGSVGVATAAHGSAEPVDPEALARLADQRLYKAKRAGRDRVSAS